MKKQIKFIKSTFYRRSDTGRFCTKEFALANPTTTQKETVKRPNPFWQPFTKLTLNLEFA